MRIFCLSLTKLPDNWKPDNAKMSIWPLTPMCSQLLLSPGIAVKVAGCWPVATWRCDQAMWESHALFDASKIILLASFLRLMKTEHCERRSLSEARGQTLAEGEWDRRPSQGWVSVFLLRFYYLRPLYRKCMALFKENWSKHVSACKPILQTASQWMPLSLDIMIKMIPLSRFYFTVFTSFISKERSRT